MLIFSHQIFLGNLIHPAALDNASICADTDFAKCIFSRGNIGQDLKDCTHRDYVRLDLVVSRISSSWEVFEN
jgi:hypothetical protein